MHYFVKKDNRFRRLSNRLSLQLKDFEEISDFLNKIILTALVLALAFEGRNEVSISSRPIEIFFFVMSFIV